MTIEDIERTAAKLPAELAGHFARAALERRYPKRTRDGLGNRDRLADHHGAELRYLRDVEAWAVYDGRRWSTEGSRAAVLGRAQRTIEALETTEAMHYGQAKGEIDPDEPDPDAKGETPKNSPRDRFLRWAAAQRYHGKHTEMIQSATALDALRARRSDFDRDPWLLNASDCVIDLRSGERRPHEPALLLMHATGVGYDPDARCPQWERLLDRALPDPEMRAYLRRVVGYTLTGRTTERAVWVHHGEAQDVRRAVMRVLRAVFGGYGQTVPRATLQVARGGRAIPIDVARMAGVRLLAPEAIPDGMLDETVVLALADGDEHSARNLREQFTDFTPVGKLHLAARYMPTAEDGLTLGAYAHGIAWDQPAPGAMDTAERVIAAELPGVLAWAVRGCLEWQRDGLGVPVSARASTADAVFHDDPAMQWLATRTERVPAERATLVAELFADWSAWAQSAGVAPSTSGALSRRLGKLGFKRDRAKDPNRSAVVLGLALRSAAPTSAGTAVLSELEGGVPWE